MALFRPALLFVLLSLGFSSCVTAPPNRMIDPPDDTEYLQTLLNSPDTEIHIPKGGRPWVSRPLFLSGIRNKTILFESGCTITAKKGSFINTGDCLFKITDSENIALIGNGAGFKMNKSDYSAVPYQPGQSRHGLSILRSTAITIEGLTIENTGGDGVYIGQNRGDPVCRAITLKNLVLSNNHRQGISVIAIDGLLIDGCRISETKGHAPMAGIDFEPNSDVYGLTNCLVTNCLLTKNHGAGIQICPKKMTASQPPIDITIENCVSRNNLVSFAVYGIPDGVDGIIKLRHNTFKGFQWIKKHQLLTVQQSDD